MIDYNLDKTSGILTLEPKSALTVNDFKSLTEEVDGYLANHDKLTGMMISIAHVPAWENFAALVQHLRFARDHHKRIARVAVLTDNSLLKIAPKIAAHFVHP